MIGSKIRVNFTSKFWNSCNRRILCGTKWPKKCFVRIIFLLFFSEWFFPEIFFKEKKRISVRNFLMNNFLIVQYFFPVNYAKNAGILFPHTVFLFYSKSISVRFLALHKTFFLKKFFLSFQNFVRRQEIQKFS